MTKPLGGGNAAIDLLEANVPEALRARKQWLVWRSESTAGEKKPRKIPYYAAGGKRTGEQGSEADRAKLVELVDALTVLKAGKCTGIGFAFLPGDGLIGIDLDNAVDEKTGEIAERALAIIKSSATYTEYSPSRLGFHLICLGESETFKSNSIGVEVFSGRQFFTVTGARLDGTPAQAVMIDPKVLRRLRVTVDQAKNMQPNANSQRAAAGESDKRIELESALAVISPDCGYDEWINIGMALEAELGEAGFAVFNYWSSRGKTYKSEADCRTHWKSFGRKAGVTGATIFKLARDRGWRGKKTPRRDQAGAGAATVSGDGRRVQSKHPLVLAREFAAASTKSQRGRLLFWQSEFYRWNGAAYVNLSVADLRAALWIFLTAAKRSVVDDVLDALRAVVKIDDEVAPPCWLSRPLERAVDLVSLRNGILDVRSRVLQRQSPDFFTLNSLDFEYAVSAQPERFLQFLSSVWEDDAETIGALQEEFGYVLVPDTSLQKAFLIVGPKRSGKGTIGRVLTLLAGRRNVVAPMLGNLGNQFGLQELIGKTLALIFDARLGHSSDVQSVVENILRVSGEDSVSIDRKFMANWNGALTVRFIVFSNELPALVDASGALASRFIVLRMAKSFLGKEDPHLLKGLVAELSAIFNWALDGLARLRARGFFVQPRAGQGVLQEFERLSSPIGEFFDEHYVLDPFDQNGIEVGAIFSAWSEWCRVNNRPASARQTFCARLLAAFPDLIPYRPPLNGGARPPRRYKGLAPRLQGLELRTASGPDQDRSQDRYASEERPLGPIP